MMLFTILYPMVAGLTMLLKRNSKLTDSEKYVTFVSVVMITLFLGIVTDIIITYFLE